VVTQAARLVLHHASPYLPSNQLTSVTSYNPYLPAMVLFGLPGAAGAPGLLGDTRPWLIIFTFVALAASFRLVVPPPRAVWSAVFGLASPMLALSLAVGITDGPIIALVCLALAFVTRPSRLAIPAGLAIGVACAMKFTAWPALPVIAAMIWARDGIDETLRFAASAVVTFVALCVAFAPGLLVHPGELIPNVVLFPLGVTTYKTPAASPVPGHLIASLGASGHDVAIGLLIAAGAGVAASLILRPPTDVRAASIRLAIGLVLLFALAPATRFGYFAYPLAIIGWLVLSGQMFSDRGEQPPLRRRLRPDRSRPDGGGSTSPAIPTP
jgi:hypothetical protein